MPGLPLSARALHTELENAGARVSLHEIPDRNHITMVSRVGQPDDPTTRYIADFVNGKG
jgi:hypothetical protein